MLAAFDGDRDLNLNCYERALVLAEEAGDLQTSERTWNNLGSRSLDEGRSTEALQHLQRGLEHNERTGHLSGLAILRHNVSEALLGLGRLDEALVESDTARDLWTSLEAPSASVSWQLRGDVQLARGNATQAAMAFAHAARLAASEDNAQFHAVALAGEAVSVVGTDPARAATLAEEAMRISTPVGHATPVVAAGWVRLSAADAEAPRRSPSGGSSWPPSTATCPGSPTPSSSGRWPAPAPTPEGTTNGSTPSSGRPATSGATWATRCACWPTRSSWPTGGATG